MTKQTGKNKVFLNDYGIVEIIVYGDQTPGSVTKLADDAEALIAKQRKNNKPALILDNLILLGKATPEARKVVVERGKSIDYDRLAFLGNDTLLRLASNLILTAIGKGNKVKYFDDYGLAVGWLTDEN